MGDVASATFLFCEKIVPKSPTGLTKKKDQLSASFSDLSASYQEIQDIGREDPSQQFPTY